MKEKKILAFERPGILNEWDFERNALLCAPDEVSIGSNKKVWWICPKGHHYQKVIEKRVSRNSGCPYCSGKAVLQGFNEPATLNPDLAKEYVEYIGKKVTVIKNPDNGAVVTVIKTPPSVRRKWEKKKKGYQ